MIWGLSRKHCCCGVNNNMICLSDVYPDAWVGGVCGLEVDDDNNGEEIPHIERCLDSERSIPLCSSSSKQRSRDSLTKFV
jgi:hypothetical protein